MSFCTTASESKSIDTEIDSYTSRSCENFVYIGKKPEGMADGFLGKDCSGRTYLIKRGLFISKGCRLFRNIDICTASEVLTTQLFRKILGPEFSPESELISTKGFNQELLLLKDTGSFSKESHLVASQWKAKAISVLDPSFDSSKPILGLTKIVTVARILCVIDFKLQHILLEDKGDYYQPLIIDCAASYGTDLQDDRTYSLKEMLNPSYQCIDIKRMNSQEFDDACSRFLKLTSKDVDDCLAKVGAVFSKREIEMVYQHLAEVQLRLTQNLK
jgi:hypothetical protein